MALTDEEREVMTESEIAQYEAAEAAKAEAEQERAAAEAAEAEAAQKAAIDEAVREALAQARAEREAEEQNVRPEPTDDIYEKLAELQYSDPKAYQKEILKLAKQEAKDEILRETDARYGGAARAVQANRVESTLSEGLGEKGKEYVRKYAHLISEENAADPLVKDLVRRGARDYERENSTRREAVEKTHDDLPIVSEGERRTADMFAEIAARASGVDINKIKPTDAQLRQFAAEER